MMIIRNIIFEWPIIEITFNPKTACNFQEFIFIQPVLEEAGLFFNQFELLPLLMVYATIKP